MSEIKWILRKFFVGCVIIGIVWFLIMKKLLKVVFWILIAIIAIELIVFLGN